MVKNWISIHKPLFGAFCETHIQSSISSRILRALPTDWRYFGNFDHHATTRIVVVWDPSVSVTVYQVLAQGITCGIFLQSENVRFTVTFVYGFNQVENIKSLWEELVQLYATSPVAMHPWAVIGDFNQIHKILHHSNHLALGVDISGMDNLNLALVDAELFEAQAKGLPYSWWNNREESPIAKKIDHTFINQAWAKSFLDSYCELLEPQQSDHAPCLLRMPSLLRIVVKPFKFFHHVMDHPLYAGAIKENWKSENIQGTFQFKLMRSLKILKPTLRRINKQHYSGITLRVKEHAAKVTKLQRTLLTTPNFASAKEEHLARAKWQTLINAEERFFRQRSRVNRLQLGDRNMSFFHKAVAQRNTRNHIHFLSDTDGRIFGTREEVHTHAVEYFQGILGTTDLPFSLLSILELQDLLLFRCSESQIAKLEK